MSWEDSSFWHSWALHVMWGSACGRTCSNNTAWGDGQPCPTHPTAQKRRYLCVASSYLAFVLLEHIKWGLIMTIHIDEYIVGHRNIIIITISYLHSTNKRSTLFCANVVPSPNFSTFVFTHAQDACPRERTTTPHLWRIVISFIDHFELPRVLSAIQVTRISPQSRLVHGAGSS
jgi:hypothetical protein